MPRLLRIPPARDGDRRTREGHAAGRRIAPLSITAHHWLGLLTLLIAPACASKPEETRPNVLLVVIDTLRVDRLGVYGHTRDTTPHLDALAREGVYCRRAFSHSGWTLPSVTSLLTGLRPHEHRVGRDPTDSKEFGSLPDEVDTLAERLGRAGYRCGAVINNTFLAPSFGLDQGFDEYDYQGSPPNGIRDASTSVRAALAWVDSDKDTTMPWFLFLHVMDPHLDYDPPQSVRGTFTPAGAAPIEVPFARAKTKADLRHRKATLTDVELEYMLALYDEEILAVDRAMGELLAGLEQRELTENTLIVVTSDHGEEFFEHGGFEHGHSMYSELTRVPLIARGPGIGRGTIATVVGHRDLYTSLLRIAHAEPDSTSNGAFDLFALAAGDGAQGRGFVLSENCLYGAPRSSIVTSNRRIIYDHKRERAEVWEVDSNGVEVRRLAGAELETERDALVQMLSAERGHLRTVKTRAGTPIEDASALEQLKALGYLGE